MTLLYQVSLLCEVFINNVNKSEVLLQLQIFKIYFASDWNMHSRRVGQDLLKANLSSQVLYMLQEKQVFFVAKI